MTKAELIRHIYKLSQTERRELLGLIFAMDEDALCLAETDGRANDRFLLLDQMEADERGVD
jgi:hypothetical protein